MVACSYILEKFPLEVFLKHAEVVDISHRKVVSYSCLNYFIDRFPNLIDESEHDTLQREFALYQCDTFSESIINGSRIDVNCRS